LDDVGAAAADLLERLVAVVDGEDDPGQQALGEQAGDIASAMTTTLGPHGRTGFSNPDRLTDDAAAERQILNDEDPVAALLALSTDDQVPRTGEYPQRAACDESTARVPSRATA
jgi:hypothetical protein